MLVSDKIVLKLGIVKGVDKEPFFRRFVLNRDEFSDGNDFVNILKSHAVMLYTGGGTDPKSVNMCDYSVSLFYRDQNNDKMIICQDDDIVEAGEEYPHVKIFAEVEFLEGNKIESMVVSVQKSMSATENNLKKSSEGTQMSVKKSSGISTEASSDLTKALANWGFFMLWTLVKIFKFVLQIWYMQPQVLPNIVPEDLSNLVKKNARLCSESLRINKNVAQQASKEHTELAHNSIQSAVAACTKSAKVLETSSIPKSQETDATPPTLYQPNALRQPQAMHRPHTTQIPLTWSQPTGLHPQHAPQLQNAYLSLLRRPGQTALARLITRLNQRPRPTFGSRLNQRPRPALGSRLNQRPRSTLASRLNQRLRPTLLASRLNQRPRRAQASQLNQRPRPTLASRLNQRPRSTLASRLNQRPRPTLASRLNQRPRPTLASRLNQRPRTTLNSQLNQRPRRTMG